MWYKSTGIIEYGPNQRCVLEIDRGIYDFYRKLIPKYIYHSPQRWPPHISICRIFEKPTAWNILDKQEIEFEYSNEIEADYKYIWLNVKKNAKIMELREKLGLNPIPSWRNCFHITLGNFK